MVEKKCFSFLKLNSKDSELIDEIAKDIRETYVNFLTTLGKGKERELYWWIMNFVSRNTLISPLFKNICYLILLKVKAKNRELPEEIIVGSPGLKRLLNDYKKTNNYNFNIAYKGKILFFIVIQQIFTFLKIASNLFLRWFFAILSQEKSKHEVPENLILLDIFLFVNSMQNGILKDRYYPGLMDHIDPEDSKKIYYIPSFYGIWNYRRIFREIRQSGLNFILKEDFLKIWDYFLALMLPFKIKAIDVKKEFEGFNIKPLIKEEILNDRVSSSSINGILNYLFVKRLREKSIKVKTFINWFENQTIDHGFNMGFQKFYSETELNGYLGIPLQNNYLSLYPTNQEKDAQVIPKKIFVIGKGFVESVKEFCPDLNVKVAPAFRHSGIWSKRKLYPDSGKYVVLIALPILIGESGEMLEMIISMAKKLELNNCYFQIKPHPSHNTNKLKSKWSKKLLYNFSFVAGDFNSCVEKSDVLISSASSACLETIAKGIPVIITGSRIGLTQLVIPKDVSKEIWRLCYGEDAIMKAIIFFHSRKRASYNKFLKIGKEIKEKYFYPVNEEGVKRLINL
jgi:hypothetical protein